jgi:hypothetical protein
MNILDQPVAMSHQLHTYTELKQQIHDDVRAQHPEWIEPNGESPCVILTKRASHNCSTHRFWNSNLRFTFAVNCLGKVARFFGKGS